MGVIGEERDYFKKFKFRVEIDDLGWSGFESCSELSAELGVIEHREGGVLLAQKDPGLITIPNLTLVRGATKDFDLYDWFKQVADMAQNAGQVAPRFKRGGAIVVMDRDDSTLCRYRIFRAWPRKFIAGEWDNNADENQMETVELVIHRWAAKKK